VPTPRPILAPLSLLAAPGHAAFLAPASDPATIAFLLAARAAALPSLRLSWVTVRTQRAAITLHTAVPAAPTDSAAGPARRRKQPVEQAVSRTQRLLYAHTTLHASAPVVVHALPQLAHQQQLLQPAPDREDGDAPCTCAGACGGACDPRVLGWLLSASPRGHVTFDTQPQPQEGADAEPVEPSGTGSVTGSAWLNCDVDAAACKTHLGELV
jgi:hypothetical protein